MVFIFISDERNGQGPLNSNQRIIIPDPRFITGSIKSCVMINKLTIIFQRLKTMCQSLWNVERQHIVFRKLQGKGFQKCWRIFPDVNDNVKYTSADATNQFYFRKRRNLVMHTP